MADAEQRVRAWVTKYALTSGIFEVNAKWCKNISEGMISYSRNGRYEETAHGKDWHTTQQAAISRAEEMRLAKIASLEKSLAKLQAKKFYIP